jgi:hypothetical protein
METKGTCVFVNTCGQLYWLQLLKWPWCQVILLKCGSAFHWSVISEYLNLILFLIFGNFWYDLSIKKQMICWRSDKHLIVGKVKFIPFNVGLLLFLGHVQLLFVNFSHETPISCSLHRISTEQLWFSNSNAGKYFLPWNDNQCFISGKIEELSIFIMFLCSVYAGKN